MLWTVVESQRSRKNYFNHFLIGWDSFHRLHVDVQAEGSEFHTRRRAMCEFDQNKDTFSDYFDELEHYVT